MVAGHLPADVAIRARHGRPIAVAKDRARPFSRKHRKYWIPVTGGMIVIGIINVALGYCSYSSAPEKHERIDVGSSIDREDPAARMARDAAKRALDKKRAAEGSGSGSGSGSGGSGELLPGQLKR